MSSRGKKASERERRRKAAAAAARKRRIITWSVISVVTVGLIAFFAFRPLPEELAAVELFADQGGGHLQPGESPPEYNSNPATSGRHNPSPTQCGIYTDEVPDQVLIHNMEHGTVVIHHAPDLDQAEIDSLHDYARSKSSHILVYPREGLSDPVVVTSWRRMLRMDSADVDTIDLYYDQFAFSGPEVGVSCPFGIDQAS